MFLSYPTLHQLQNLFRIRYEMLKMIMNRGIGGIRKVIAWLSELPS